MGAIIVGVILLVMGIVLAITAAKYKEPAEGRVQAGGASWFVGWIPPKAVLVIGILMAIAGVVLIIVGIVA